MEPSGHGLPVDRAAKEQAFLIGQPRSSHVRVTAVVAVSLLLVEFCPERNDRSKREKRRAIELP